MHCVRGYTDLRLYGCELYGVNIPTEFEQFHTTYLKALFRVKTSTKHTMLYEAAGELTIQRKAIYRCLCYWGKLVHDNNGKLSAKVYHKTVVSRLKWQSDIKSWLDKLNLSVY